MEGPQLETQVIPCVLIFCSWPGVWGLGEIRETRAPDQASSLAGGAHPHPVKRKECSRRARPGGLPEGKRGTPAWPEGTICPMGDPRCCQDWGAWR